MRYLTAIALLLMPATALAQEAQTQTQAGAEANTNVAVTAITGPIGDSHSRVTYDGHTWTTPNVGGSYFGGANPCLVGTGGGVAGGPLGLSINVGKSDKHCSRRSDAAAWHALGMSGVAIARMCEDEDNARAFWASTGFVCPGADPKRYTYSDGSPGAVAVIVNNTQVQRRGQ